MEHSFLIHNGKKFIPIKISEEMVGHKLGEFSPTRQFSLHIHQLIRKLLKLAQGSSPGASTRSSTKPAAPGATPKVSTRRGTKSSSSKKDLKMMQKNKNTVKSINRNVRSSPRKINLLLRNIRGKKADTSY